MRIALVIERFEPAGGGMEAVAWQVAHGLAAAGDDVHVVARTAAETAAVTLHQVTVPSLWQPVRVRGFSREATRAAPRAGYDVVHAFSRTRHQDLYRAGGGSHADYLERVHSGAGRALRRLSPRHALLLRLEREIFEDGSQIVQCGSRLVQREITTRFGVAKERTRVLYNGVDLERFRPPDSLGTARGKGHRPVWLFAGSGWRRKGLDIALAALARSGSDACLQVAGRDAPGAWQREAERLGLAQRVEFLGPVRDVARLYRESDALLLPTRYDAFANVCLEAAASGLPVVTSGTNGSAEILGDAGIVVDDPEDIAGFAAALEQLHSPELRERMGECGRKVAEGFSWPHHIEQLRELYRECCARKHA